MKVEWIVLTDEEVEAYKAQPEIETARDPLHCECGRFAKYLGDRHYYNGTWDCYSYTVRCSRCGDVTIECV